MVCACVFYRDISSTDGSQSKLNASVYLEPHSLGFKFARILRQNLSFQVMARFA